MIRFILQNLEKLPNSGMKSVIKLSIDSFQQLQSNYKHNFWKYKMGKKYASHGGVSHSLLFTKNRVV